MKLQKNAGVVRGFAIAMRLVSWLQTIPHKLTPTPFRLIQIGSAFWQSRALYVAAKLDIATVLRDEKLDVEMIGTRVLANADAIGRLLRMLASIGVFAEVAPRVFRNNKLSVHLRTDNPKNVRAMILMHNSEAMSRPWYEQFENGVRKGVPPFELSNGEALFDYLDRHAEFDSLFSEAMDSVEALTGDSFATDFNWDQFNRIIDLGGSRGAKSLAILKRHLHLTALVLDRAQVIQTAPSYWVGKTSPALLSRISYQAGNVLESVPVAINDKDIYLLSAVLHGMDDGLCIKVLSNLAIAAAGTRARVALMELVVPDFKADFSSAVIDLQMFMATNGRERTFADWQRLFDPSG
ncbi:MAG: methyltransferase, partial [Methylobacter sp.]